MENRIRVEIADRIARVTLNRPDKRNALDRDMFESLTAAGEALLADRTVRAVVLSGAGGHFCAGIDVAVFSAADGPVFGPRDMAPRSDSGANFFQSAALVWRRMPIPVIAAICGVAFGAGLQVALGADLRFARPDSRWSIMEVRWGLVPDMGISVTARGLVSPDRLKRLAFTGTIIDGTQAHADGLVTELHDNPEEAALTLARDIARQSPEAVRAIKSLIDESRTEQPDLSLRREAALQASVIGSPNQLEAVNARVRGREPEFADPHPGAGAG